MQPQQTTTLAQKIDIVAGAALFVAMPVIIFLRKKPGYRFLSPIKILLMFLALNALAGFSYFSGNPGTVTVLTIFAWATLITGLVKRQLRWREIKNGLPWHTYSRGVSWLIFLPLSDSAIKRWIDPLVVIIVGIVMAVLFSWFGLYLIFAGFCLFVFEAWDYERSLNQMLDVLDSLVDSEVISANVEYYSRSNPQQRPIEETAGIPTGIAPDIQSQIERRKAGRALPPDNLVATMPLGQPEAAR